MTSEMATFLALLGFPAFTWIAGLMVVAAVAAFGLGIARWRKAHGKVLAISGGVALLALAFVIAAVLATVWSGSMG